MGALIAIGAGIAVLRDLAKFIMRGEKTPLLEDWAFERLLK